MSIVIDRDCRKVYMYVLNSRLYGPLTGRPGYEDSERAVRITNQYCEWHVLQRLSEHRSAGRMSYKVMFEIPFAPRHVERAYDLKIAMPSRHRN